MRIGLPLTLALFGIFLQMKWLNPALLLALLSGGCGGDGAPAGPPLKLTIAEFSQPAAALLYVAEARGYLRESGLEVTFKSFNIGKDALNNVVEGQSDIAAVFQTPVVLGLRQGKPLGILSTLMTSTRNTVLLARRYRQVSDTGDPASLAIADTQDLEGKTIGVTRGTSGEYFLSVFLATEGIPQQRVNIVNVVPSAFDKTLVAGDVDAMVVFSSHRVRLKKAMGDQLVVFSSNAYADVVVLAGLRQTIASRPEAMARLMAAVVKAQDYIASNREDSIRIVARRLAGKVDEADIRETWDDYRFAARLDNALMANMRSESEWYQANTKLSGVTPDFLDAIVIDPLRRARRASVTLQISPELR
jgi:ABC-type nitrate/sulfonate/bicarbonate transport system substrate-binding protein